MESQWHKIVLPPEIFQNTKADFSDTRIKGFTNTTDTIEAPYILHRLTEKTEQLEVSFNLINQSKNKNEYYFTFETPIENAHEVNEIQLNFKTKNFDWKVSLEGSQNQLEWFTLLEEYRILSMNTESTNFQYTHLNFPSAKYRYYRLIIPADDKPELSATKLLLSSVVDGKYNIYNVKSRTVEEDKKNKLTTINLDLKHAVPVSKLKLYVKNNYDYFRNLHISYVNDSVQTEKGWKYSYRSLTSATLNSLEKTEFTFESTVLKKLKIDIENQDNTPLQIDSLEVEGYVHELVARFTAPATYFLTYGNALAQKPNYDIERFSDRIPEDVKELRLGDEQFIERKPKEQSAPLFQNAFWLWGVMILIILLLGWFSLKMIRQK